MNWKTPLFLTVLVLLTNVALAMSETRRLFPTRRGFVGGVYVMTNNAERNSILAYGRRFNGSLERIGEYNTRGLGGGEEVEPLFSAYSTILTPDKRFLIAVNTGSASISVFKVLRNFGLRLRSVGRVPGFGPSSVAYHKGIVYATSIGSDRPPASDPGGLGLKGALTGFRLNKFGKLRRIRNSVRWLDNRPATVQFSTNGRSLIVTSVTAGVAQLDTTAVDEIYVFRVLKSGRLSAAPVDAATSTFPNNPEGRSLPAAVGVEAVRVGGSEYAIVTESRFLSGSGAGLEQQVSSISTWRITDNNALVPEQLDLLIGSSFEEGQEGACWLELSKTKEYYWVANTVSGTISSFSFKNGKSTLIEEVAGSGPLLTDLWLSADGRFLYQLGAGHVGVYEVEKNGFGPGLTHIQTVTDVPEMSAQGIVAI